MDPTIPVTLIVKAPNQQFEDQTIKCEVTWSIKRLKGYLSEVYPCKPSTEEQKLIYSGQLLSDTVILKDVLRQYEGQETHTVHLVYTPKDGAQIWSSRKESTMRQSTTHSEPNTFDGVRQRNVPATTNSLNCPVNGNNTVQQPNFINNVPFAAGTSSAANANVNLMAQQMAMQNWMQQAYLQYLNQYQSLLMGGLRPEQIYLPQSPNQGATTSASSGSANPNGQPQMPYFPSTQLPLFQGSTAPHFAMPQQPTSTTQMQPNSADVAGATQQPAASTGDNQQPQVAANNAVAAPEAAAPPQPRFPNIVHEELPENRDWLDIFYTLSRLMILLTLVFFYSSPMRFIAVMLVGFVLYVYHMYRQANRETNNNNINNNQNRQAAAQPPIAAAPAAVVEDGNVVVAAVVEPEAVVEQPPPPPVDQVDQGVATPLLGAEDAVAVDSVPNSNNQEEPTSRTTVIAFLRTFVLSFFASLIPETPAL